MSGACLPTARTSNSLPTAPQILARNAQRTESGLTTKIGSAAVALCACPINGGTPENVPGTMVPHTIFTQPGFGISTDGKYLAVLLNRLETNVSDEKIVLVPLDAGPKSAGAVARPRSEDRGESTIRTRWKRNCIFHSRKRCGQSLAPAARWLPRPPDHYLSKPMPFRLSSSPPTARSSEFSGRTRNPMSCSCTTLAAQGGDVVDGPLVRKPGVRARQFCNN